MAHLLAGLATGQGFSASRLPGVKFMRSTAYAPPTPITYEPSIVVVAQGRKAGRLGERTFLYDANHYLVLAAPLPFECETFGTPEEPMLGLSVAVTPTLVGELLEQMRSSPADDGSDRKPSNPHRSTMSCAAPSCACSNVSDRRTTHASSERRSSANSSTESSSDRSAPTCARSSHHTAGWAGSPACSLASTPTSRVRTKWSRSPAKPA
jgi:hypothetical protein